MRFWPYMIASVLGIIPGTIVFLNLGDKALDPASPSFWLAVALLIALFAGTFLMGKKLFPNSNRNSNEEDV